MRYAYKDLSFRSDSLERIATINAVIKDFMAQGFRLSVRQLYYQLVAAAIIENTERSYKRTADLINNARIAGLMDWDAIEDRGRDIELRTRWSGGDAIVQAAADSFHMDMWITQPVRVFCVVEKAALAGVLGGVCRKWDIPLLAARGYPSVSIVRDMVNEHIRPALLEGQHAVLLHLGDHDPSGKDMTRDLEERIAMFLEDNGTCEVNRQALNIDQVRRLKPPPNPAKITDSRAKAYIREFGAESWELDALKPQYLVKLVDDEVQKLVDVDAWDEREAEVEDIRERLQASADSFKAE